MKTSPCSRFSEVDLIALELGESSALRRAALRRHLAHCPDCAAAASEIAAARAQAICLTPTPASAPDALRERIWRNAPVSSVPENAPRPPFVGRLALGVCTGVAVIAAVALLPGTVGHPTIAFAQVEKAMTEIKTVTWEDSYTNAPSFFVDGRVETHSSKRPSVSWARFSPATVADVGGPPEEQWCRDVSLGKERYQICSAPHQPLAYSYFPNGGICGEKGASAEDRLRDIIIFRLPKDDAESGGDDKADTRRNPWVSAEDTLNRRRVIRFTQNSVFPGGVGMGKIPWRETGRKRVVWVDPESHLIVQRDIHTFFSDGKRQIEMTDQRKNFRYNLTPPDGVFEYRPAVGTRYSFVPLPERPATDAQQRGVETAVRRAFDAWNRRDASLYAGAWDFDHTSANLEAREKNRREQLRYMTSGVPFRTWRIVKIMKASSRIDGLFLYRTADDKFPPTEPSEFRTFAQVMGTDSKGRTREEWVNINLRRDGDDYRLVRVYWEWILKRKK